MSPLEALIHLLILPADQPEPIVAWLRLAAANLQGFATQPEVIRRSTNRNGMQAEVRRWSQVRFLPLMVQTPRTPGLFLHPSGQLYIRKLDGTRYLRNDPGDKIVDEIYHYLPQSTASEAQLTIVQQKVIAHLLHLGYANWNQLPLDRRLILAQFGGAWEDALAALSSVSGDEYLQTLQLFLGDKVHPQLRQEVLSAGLDGRHRPAPEVLAWLLAQADWNLDPCLVTMARNAAADAPDQAWLLIHHPNAQVRLRLLDVYTGEADWFEWLVCENDDKVRSRLLGAIEQSYTPASLVAQLANEVQAARREAIGWALAHWRPIVTAEEDWQALNNALFMSIGKLNRQDLKESLDKHGKLSFKARFFS